MKNTFQYFLLAVEDIYRNWPVALQISGSIFAIAIFAVTFINYIFTGNLVLSSEQILLPDINDAQMSVQQGIVVQQNVFLPLVIGQFIMLCAFSFIGVSWHRFAVNNEISNGFFKSHYMTEVLLYCWKIIMLYFLIAFALIIMWVLIVMVLSFLPRLQLFLIFGSFFVFYYLFFRLGMILPNTALGQKMTLMQSFKATSFLSNQIWLTVLILSTFNIVIGTISQIAPANIIGVLIGAVIQWILMMLTISILTVFYKKTL